MSVYKYISLTRLRAEGVEVADLDDEKAVALIIRISKQLNVWTGQRFVPLRETLQLDGRGTGLVRVPFFLLELISLSAVDGYGYARGSDTPAGSEGVEFADWELPSFPRREATLLGTLSAGQVKTTPWLLESTRGVFPEGAQNVQLLAYAGWQDELRKLETTLTTDLAPDATEAEVASVTGFRKGAMVVFEVNDEVVHSVILLGTEAGPPAKLLFDKALDLGETIPSGSKVLSFGFVPEAISTVCAALCVQHRFPLASAESEEAAVDRMLISEKTDNYQYRLQRPDGGGSSITGDPYLDGLLDHYTRPRRIGLV